MVPHLPLSPSTSKTDLRSALLSRRQEIAPQDREQWSLVCNRNIVAYIDATARPTVAGFLAIRSEIDIMPALLELEKEGCIIALPRIIRGNKMLSFKRFTLGDDFEQGAYGVVEPLEEAPGNAGYCSYADAGI